MNGFTPNLSDTFQFLTYASRTGTFATISDNLGGLALTPTYNATNLTVSVVAGGSGGGASQSTLMLSPSQVDQVLGIPVSLQTPLATDGTGSMPRIRWMTSSWQSSSC